MAHESLSGKATDQHVDEMLKLEVEDVVQVKDVSAKWKFAQ